jgi:hypothetical protein
VVDAPAARVLSARVWSTRRLDGKEAMVGSQWISPHQQEIEENMGKQSF